LLSALGLLPASAVYIPPPGFVSNFFERTESLLFMAVESFFLAGQTGAEGLQQGVAVNPVGIEGDGRRGAGDGGGEDQASPQPQNPDHLGKSFSVGGRIELIAVPSQAEMLQGAEGDNQVKRFIGQGELFSVTGYGSLIFHGRVSGADIDGSDGIMGEQTQDEMSIGTYVQNLSGLQTPDVKGGKGTFVIDEILGMIPSFKQRFLKQLKPARVAFQGLPLLVIEFLQTQPNSPKDFTTESQSSQRNADFKTTASSPEKIPMPKLPTRPFGSLMIP
jgi:hypothetical protein